MEDLRFIQGLSPKGFKSDFESFLFNQERHRHLQSPVGWHSFHLVSNTGKKILASVHFHLHAGSAASPAKAPFGSVEFSSKAGSANLYNFLQEIEKALGAAGASRIEIKNPPACYRPAQSTLLEVLLLNLGYRVSNASVNAAVPVDDVPYESKIESWELRKLKQGKKARLRFLPLDPTAFFDVYEFVLACRLERQQSLSMTAEDLVKVVEAFPGRILLFAVYQDQDLAAASIAIRVSDQILYNFYSAHPKKFDSLSPVVTLVNGMYAWCRKNDLEMIDLGTSAQADHPNFSLLDFKIRLGGIPSAKLAFEKALV